MEYGKFPRPLTSHALRVRTGERRREEARRLRDILSGTLEHQPDQLTRLPDESALSKGHGTSRNTVREALHLLAEEGRIRRQVGTGSFPAMIPSRYRFDRLLDGSEITGRYARLDSALLGLSVLESIPDTLRTSLDLPADATRLAIFERVESADGTPVELRTYLLPLVPADAIDETIAAGDVYAYIETGQRKSIASAARAVSAVAADAGVAAILRVPESTPLLFIESTLFDDEGRVLLVTYGRHRNDRVTVTFNAVRERGRTNT